MCFKSQRQHLAQLRHAGISLFDPEPAGCLLEPEINFSCQSKEGWNTTRKTEHSAFRDLSIFIIWLQAEHKLVETRQAGTQKVQYHSFHALFIYNSALNPMHFLKQLCSFPITLENSNVYFSQVSSLLFQAKCGI